MMTADDCAETSESDKKISTPWLAYPASPLFTSPGYTSFTPELHPLDMGTRFRHPPVSESIMKANRVSGGDDCELHMLLDFAIRNLITSKPSKVMREIEQVNPRGEPRLPKLSDIAPSVFSPGYHDVGQCLFLS
jgi:hypothetical protein